MIWATDEYLIPTRMGMRRGTFWTYTDEGECTCDVCERAGARLFAFEDTGDDYGSSIVVCIDCMTKVRKDGDE